MATDYYVISKIPKIPFNEYNGKIIRVSKTVPAFVDEVIIGIKGDNSKIKKITTYKNDEGIILERSFDYSGAPVKNRVYDYFRNKVKNSDAVINSREIKEYSLPQKYVKKFLKKNTKNKHKLWQYDKTQTHHIYSDPQNGLVHSMTQINNIKDARATHTITEFPHKISGNDKTKKKSLSFDVDTGNHKVIWGSQKAENVVCPKKDSFLAVRFLPIQDFVRAVTNRFINEHHHGLENSGIKVNFVIPPFKVRDIISGRFCPESGVIEFNKQSVCMKSKNLMVRNSAHEAEHSWQYFLHARNGGAVYPWETKVARQFGDLKNNPGLQQEADSYFNAIEDYVPIEKDKKAYFDNYIEKCARDKGDKAQECYINQGRELRNEFRFIPEEML